MFTHCSSASVNQIGIFHQTHIEMKLQDALNVPQHPNVVDRCQNLLPFSIPLESGSMEEREREVDRKRAPAEEAKRK